MEGSPANKRRENSVHETLKERHQLLIDDVTEPIEASPIPENQVVH